MNVVLVEHSRGSVILRPNFNTSFYTESDILAIARIYWMRRCECSGKFNYGSTHFEFVTIPNSGIHEESNGDLFCWEAAFRRRGRNS